MLILVLSRLSVALGRGLLYALQWPVDGLRLANRIYAQSDKANQQPKRAAADRFAPPASIVRLRQVFIRSGIVTVRRDKKKGSVCRINLCGLYDGVYLLICLLDS